MKYRKTLLPTTSHSLALAEVAGDIASIDVAPLPLPASFLEIITASHPMRPQPRIIGRPRHKFKA
jgi:hypothetical protein